MARDIFDQDDEKEIREVLVGRRIVEVRERTSEMVLDDGTVLKFEANEGGCACSAGDYSITKLAGVDNAIMSVEVVEDSIPYEERNDYGDSQRYSIFVMAEGVQGRESIFEVEGDDGNGYYGTGFRIYVEKG